MTRQEAAAEVCGNPNLRSPGFVALGFVASLVCGFGCSDSDQVPGVNLSSGKEDSIPVQCPGGEARPHRTWTIMHYAAADNNLQEALLHDINEMELGMNNGSPNVNVVVQLDRWDTDGVWRYEVKGDTVANDPERNKIVSELVGHSDEEPNSGDYKTLIEFGRWAVSCYPAENYMVIIGGHGRGWSVVPGQSGIEGGLEGGVEFDQDRAARAAEQPGGALRFIAPDDTGSEIYASQLVLALEAIRALAHRPGDPNGLNRIVAYGSDACLMGTVEMAYDLRNSARYVIGSEQLEPGYGWPYSTILRDLNDRPTYYSQQCSDTCDWANDGVCDDDGVMCDAGTDCSDCGMRGHTGELMAEFVDSYKRSYGPGGATGQLVTDFTLSAIATDGAEGNSLHGMPLIRGRNRIKKIVDLLMSLLDEDPASRAAITEQLLIARSSNQVFGDTYTDLGRFLHDLRSGMIEAGLMPAAYQTWVGDERYRELRNAINELLEDVWPELLVSVANGPDYPDLMGLSVYMPNTTCNEFLPLSTYADSDFAIDSGWDKLVETILLEDIPFAEGGGTMNMTLGGADYSGTVHCEIEDNVLYVLTSDDDPSAPQLQMQIQRDGTQLSLGRAAIDLRHLDGIRASHDSSIEFANSSYRSGKQYSGTVVIPFYNWQGEPHTATISFQCSNFKLACPAVH